MNTLKSAILTLLILIGLLAGYICFKFDSNYVLKLTADSYEKQDYVRASERLSSLKKKPSPKVHLYEGYILRAKKQYEQSTAAFLAAFEEESHLDLKKEASFNLLLNAYLSEDFAFIQEHLRKEADSAAYSKFFTALLLYHQRDYAKAYDHFVVAEDREYYSSWMQQEWNAHFPKAYEIGQIAHCLIEIGKPHQGRLLLENHLKKFEATEEELSFFIGLSYLREAQDRPLNLALAYFKNAHTYLKLRPLKNPECEALEKKVSLYFETYLNALLKEALYQPLTEVLPLIQDLNLTNERTYALLLDRLDYERNGHPENRFLELLQQVSPLLSHAPFKEQLTLYSLAYAKDLITADQVDVLNKSWPELQKTLDLNDLDFQTFSEHIQTHLFALIEQDEDSLSSTYDLLLFWDSIERDDSKRLEFLTAFFPAVRELWFSTPSKALQLSKYMDQFSHLNQKPQVQEKMLEILQEVSCEIKSPNLQEAYFYFNPLITR